MPFPKPKASCGVIGLLGLLACWVSRVALAATWSVSVDQVSGLPAITKGGGAAMSSALLPLATRQTRRNQATVFDVVAPFEYRFSFRNATTGSRLVGYVRKVTDRQLSWQIEVDADDAVPEDLARGIAFKFDIENFGLEMGEPVLLPSNRGWVWGKADRSKAEMRFDPPLAEIHFEPGKKNEIRAFFHNSGIVRQGRRRLEASLTVSSDIEIRPTLGERFGLDGPLEWPANMLDYRTSPVDLSFLNAKERPAGKRGFLRTAKDSLVFDDGTQARFWGTNLTSSALFGTSSENVKRQARRLSELGFNLVRIHHHDSAWVNPNIFGNREAIDTQSLSDPMLERLDWWIACLKAEGIYVWLDLHVGRQFKAGDAIDAFGEISKGQSSAEVKGYNYVNASIQAAMKKFNDAYLNHENRYTGVRYKDEPAIVAMLISNENDLTGHYGNALLPDRDVPVHSRRYLALASDFAVTHGLPGDKTWRSWEPGPAKLFLNDLERRVNADMIAHLRSIGVKVPIVTTSTWGSNPLSSLPAAASGDIVDAHSYGAAGELEKNPIYAPTFLHWLAAAQVAGKPLSVTEWNVEGFPVPDRHAMPLFVAASARFQGWDALMQYAYSPVPVDGPGYPSNWQAFNDPAMLAAMPAAALLFRRGDVREAFTVYAFSPDRKQLFNQSLSPRNAPALRTAAEKGKLVIVFPPVRELPWLVPSEIPAGARVLTDAAEPLIDEHSPESVSDTGELRRNWDQGIFTIDTARTQSAMGWIGGHKISLSDVVVEVTTRNATVAVQSLDDKPISKSGAILISLGARSLPAPMGKLPYHSEPVVGQLAIRASRGLKLYGARDTAKNGKVLPTAYKAGWYRIPLDRTLGTYWLALRVPLHRKSF